MTKLEAVEIPQPILSTTHNVNQKRILTQFGAWHRDYIPC